MFYACTRIVRGAAGLNAALVLGRARRRVAMFDSHHLRNEVTHATHGFLTRDGVTPIEFRRIAYNEVLHYPSVEHHPAKVKDIHKLHDGFQIITGSGESIQSRKLLVATGLKEILPAIPGLTEMYGKSLFH